MDETSALTLRMLEEFDTVAVVGLSSDPIKAAFDQALGEAAGAGREVEHALR